jgi:hypothetical protein
LAAAAAAAGVGDQMEVPQARSGWSGGLVTLVPSTTGKALFTAKTRERLAKSQQCLPLLDCRVSAAAAAPFTVRSRHLSGIKAYLPSALKLRK